MTLPVTQVGENPQVPSISAQTFVPDQLIAGPKQIVTRNATITGGPYARGTVLGIITASGKLTIATSAASDGSQNPAAILADYADGSAADVTAGVFLEGEFNINAITLGAGITSTAARDALRPLGIHLKTSVTAADPS
ncbi:TPA: head decoration protein [Burkholderia vietnamiensis]|nr:head decoration protein [Burkholderia vietnamiensis]HDR9210633.1 head decoration protein [Burkholderia vietnamiensis]